MATSEKKGLKTGNGSKNSAGKSDSLTLAPHRRASVGAYPPADSSQDVVPHYLRASTGSCHDLCKLGREHSFEKKERKPFPKRIGKTLPGEPYTVQILVSNGQKREKVVDCGPSTDRKNQSPDQKPSSDTKSYSPKPKPSLDKDKDKDKAMKQKPSKDLNNHSFDIPSLHNKSNSRKPTVPSDAKTHSLNKNGSSGNKTLLSKSKPSNTKKFPSADPPEIVKSVIFPSKEVEDSVKQGSSNNKTSRADKKTTYVSRERSSTVKSKPVTIKPPSSSENSDGVHVKGRRNINAKTGRNLIAPKAPAKKVLVAPAAMVSPRLRMIKTAHTSSGKAGNLKLSSPLKDQIRIRRAKTKESNDEKVSEKTLHVVETEPANNVSKTISEIHTSSLPSESSVESLSSTNYSSSSSNKEEIAETEQSGSEVEEVISDDNNSEEIVKVQPVKENRNKTLRKSRVVVPEEKCRSPVKLKFRSGKVVDLQSDNNSPRRLRFRKPRVIGAEDSKGNSRRALKKAVANDDKTSAEASSEKVVLKHQDVQGKKDAQGLLNNVIEETASKLAESRKSKVKALVGAFETVISLQEIKPAT